MELICLGAFGVFPFVVIATAMQSGKAAKPKARRSTQNAPRAKSSASSASHRASRRDDDTDVLSAGSSCTGHASTR
jgi:hypothetical protein